METKKVVIELTVKMIIEVPKDWDEDSINFYLNESSHCLEAEVFQLAREVGFDEEKNPSLCSICHRAKGIYIQDANEENIENLRYA